MSANSFVKHFKESLGGTSSKLYHEMIFPVSLILNWSKKLMPPKCSRTNQTNILLEIWINCSTNIHFLLFIYGKIPHPFAILCIFVLFCATIFCLLLLYVTNVALATNNKCSISLRRLHNAQTQTAKDGNQRNVFELKRNGKSTHHILCPESSGIPCLRANGNGA